jgi:virginiamycin B lyase
MTVINDVIWYVESNTRPNNMVRFDPKTEKFQTWQIPEGGGGIVRHMMPTPDGNIAMAMSGLSQVGIMEILPSASNCRALALTVNLLCPALRRAQSFW